MRRPSHVRESSAPGPGAASIAYGQPAPARNPEAIS